MAGKTCGLLWTASIPALRTARTETIDRNKAYEWGGYTVTTLSGVTAGSCCSTTASAGHRYATQQQRHHFNPCGHELRAGKNPAWTLRFSSPFFTKQSATKILGVTKRPLSAHDMLTKQCWGFLTLLFAFVAEQPVFQNNTLKTIWTLQRPDHSRRR